MLLLTLLVGCGLGWWLRPYTIETHWPNGQLKAKLAVRRSFAGDLVTNGQQAWWWRNGQIARRGESHNYSLSDGIFSSKRMAYASGMDLEESEMYDEQGEKLNAEGIDFCLLFEFDFQPPVQELTLSPADRFAETPHE